MALPGRPVRVQWMREQEHSWEPYGSALTHVRAALDQQGQIVAWDYTVRSGTHSTWPGGAGNLMPPWHR
jgi:nicotinate dehydrogenase subunit B